MAPEGSEGRHEPLDIFPDPRTARRLVGRGWWPLLDAAFAVAEREGVRIGQIKEKLGHLCVYYDCTTAEQWERLGPVEDDLLGRSAALCEACGAPGTLHTEFGWLKTLCGDCATRRAAGQSWKKIFGFQPYTTPRD
jgi:hypothetical protein